MKALKNARFMDAFQRVLNAIILGWLVILLEAINQKYLKKHF